MFYRFIAEVCFPSCLHYFYSHKIWSINILRRVFTTPHLRYQCILSPQTIFHLLYFSSFSIRLYFPKIPHNNMRSSSTIIYLCFLLSVSCEDAFYFPQHPRFPDNVVEGQRLVVNCQVSETASIVYYWQQNGRNIDNTFRRYHNVSSLVFEIVHRQRDVGEYQCTAFNTSSGHTVSSSIAQLNVGWIGQDAKVALLSPKNIEEIHEGNSLTLKCIIEGTGRATFVRQYNLS